jgi:hypothetical protein
MNAKDIKDILMLAALLFGGYYVVKFVRTVSSAAGAVDRAAGAVDRAVSGAYNNAVDLLSSCSITSDSRMAHGTRSHRIESMRTATFSGPDIRMAHNRRSRCRW